MCHKAPERGLFLFMMQKKEKMIETIYSRAVLSAFQDQLEVGIEQPELQLKVVERRMRQLASEEDGTFSQLLALLLQGLSIKFDSQDYVAQVDELQTSPTGGLVKRLSRTVDKKTKNPKTSRGTVWRRNSAVQERRRLLPNWRSGSTAMLAAKRKSVVQLVPMEVWTAEKESNGSEDKDRRLSLIREKQSKRNQKQALIAEYERRMQQESSVEQQLADEVMLLLADLTEKRGLANQAEFYKRVIKSIENEKPLPLLFVWGPPYEGQGNDQNLFEADTPEAKMADEIEAVIDKLCSIGLSIQPILLYADTYGTEINGLSEEEVLNYYQNIKERFADVGALRWSEVRACNQQRYDQLNKLVDQQLVVPDKTVANAELVQAKLGVTISRQTAIQLATLYIKERTIEGIMLNEGFMLGGQKVDNIVKLGTAPTRFRNDEPYEEELPRIYIKNMTRAAWNTAR